MTQSQSLTLRLFLPRTGVRVPQLLSAPLSDEIIEGFQPKDQSASLLKRGGERIKQERAAAAEAVQVHVVNSD